MESPFYGLSFGRIGKGSKGADSWREKTQVYQTCIGCCGEVFFITELPTAEDAVET